MLRYRSFCIAATCAIALAAVAQWAAPAPLAASNSPSCNITGVERVVAIGDVHGSYDRFVQILTIAGLIDDRQRWTGGRTHLVQTGDVLDRGPESREALDLLRRLQDEAARTGGAVHPLIGNHEAMRLLGDMRYVSPGEFQAFMTPQSDQIRQRLLRSNPETRDALMKTPLGFTELRQAFGRDGEYGKWIRTLDAVIRIDGVLFMHGGISRRIASLSCEAINDTVRKDLSGDLERTRANPQTTVAASEDGPLWYRGLGLEPDSFAPEVDRILAAQHARAIVVGHTIPGARRILQRFGSRVIQIDTGMQPAYVPDGRASALEIKDGVVTAIYGDRRDVLAPLPAEPPAPPSTPGR